MVQESVEQGGSDDGIPEDIAPFCKATIGGEDHCAAFIACVDELEEEIAAAGDDGKITDFVDDQQAWSAEEARMIWTPRRCLGGRFAAPAAGAGR